MTAIHTQQVPPWMAHGAAPPGFIRSRSHQAGLSDLEWDPLRMGAGPDEYGSGTLVVENRDPTSMQLGPPASRCPFNQI